VALPIEVLALAFVVATTPAPLPEDPAERAGALFERGRFADAAAAFSEAYAETGDPALLFGRAQALRRAGNCKAAIEVFEAFIAAGPPERDIEEAKKVIEDCREILGEETQAEPPPPIPPVDAEPEPLPPPPPKWWRDPAGGVLLGTGLATTAVGGVLYGVSFARAGDRPGETEMEFEDRRQSVRGLSAAGISLLAVGGALLVGALVRYAVVGRATSAPSSADWRRAGGRPPIARGTRP
jgi:tetratricopeptide (TPR) repeat protein